MAKCLQPYCDPVVPKAGEYKHGETTRKRSHLQCLEDYFMDTAIGVGKAAFCAKYFFAGVVTGKSFYF